MKTLCAFAALALSIVLVASIAELKIPSGNGAKSTISILRADFELATGSTINLHFAVNTDPEKKTETGEAVDVAALNPLVIDALIKDGKLAGGARGYIGRAGASTAQ